MTTTVPKRERSENQLLTLFRIPVFRRIWAAIAFSSLGDWLGLLANTALAQQLTSHQSGSTQGAAISGVILVRLAPDLLFGAIAAAIADKLDRRKIVIIGDLTAGVLYALDRLGLQPDLALRRAVRHRGRRAVHPAVQAGHLGGDRPQAAAGDGQPDLADVGVRHGAGRGRACSPCSRPSTG